MTRNFSSFPVPDDPLIKEKLLAWANGFDVCCVLDSFSYDLPHQQYELLIGAGAERKLLPGEDLISSVAEFDQSTTDWIFGHFGYEALTGKSESGFSHAFLFVPEIVLQLKAGVISIGVHDDSATQIYRQIESTALLNKTNYQAELYHRISRQQFVDAVTALQHHIRRGDCYEINYCQEFYTTLKDANALDLYQQLTTISPNPFSVFYKVDHQYALCASPERYLKKTGDTLISQPIKGTISRDLNDADQDERNRKTLVESEKDRRENVIVVDLVRNDLSRVCEPGSVKVEELFGVYAFPSVYQMISTVTGKLPADKDFASVLEATFPMGSMTGAPKKKVMELIKKYEPVDRGLYSGTIGYIDPEKNYDFNVVIRTILYNGQSGYLNYLAGAGITDLSDPEQEYEECLLKAAALQKLLTS